MLATRTRHVHEELHQHPWISSLADPGLSIDRYGSVLGSYHAFYDFVEQAFSRYQLPACLSLGTARDLLQSDLDCLSLGTSPGPDIALELPIDSPQKLLGALYVLHGSSFGATILDRNVRQVLPEAPRHFLGARMAREQWQCLNQELERFHDDDLAREKLYSGAEATFRAFGSFVTRYCEAHHTESCCAASNHMNNVR